MAVLNEEQEMLRDMARDWATNESPVSEFRKVRSAGEPQAYSADAYAKMAEMGWAGIVIPEAHGGSDFGFMSAGLVVEELGKTLTASPLVATTIAASAIILSAGVTNKRPSGCRGSRAAKRWRRSRSTKARITILRLSKPMSWRAS